MALQKTLLKKRLKYRHPLPPKTYFCDKTFGSRELIFGTIPIKKCMNNFELSHFTWNDLQVKCVTIYNLTLIK